MIKYAKKEVLLIFATANAFCHYERQDILQILKQITIDRGAKVRILIPANQHIVKTIEDAKSRLPEIDIRSIDKSLQTHMTI